MDESGDLRERLRACQDALKAARERYLKLDEEYHKLYESVRTIVGWEPLPPARDDDDS